jgi:hypothetical protein
VREILWRAAQVIDFYTAVYLIAGWKTIVALLIIPVGSCCQRVSSAVR